MAEKNETAGAVNKAIVGAVLAGFLALNGYAFYADGQLMGLVRTVMELRGWGLVLGVDLMIALTMVAVWIIGDARKQGTSGVPYALLTVTTGSIGSLLYLLRKPSSER
jgi:hypothetical protein